jgi:hypothetical protein
MARSIADIEKAIADKEKMGEKTIKEAPKVQKEVETLAKEQLDLEKEVKSEKDKKKKAELEKKLAVAIDKHKAAKLKQSTMETAEDTIKKAIETLKQELKDAKDGVEKYGKARKEGIAMLTREGKKLKVFWDTAKQKAADAEDCSRLAESSTKKGDVNTAQGAKINAGHAVMAAVQAERGAVALIKEITETMTASQRNLKAKDFDVVDGDILVHNNLTKQVQDDFKDLESMASECTAFRKLAEKAAREATEFADASAVGLELYEQILDEAMKHAQEKVKDIQNSLGSKWGGYITARGELFTRLLTAFKEKPNDPGARIVAEKAVEQGQTFLVTAKKSIDNQIQELMTACKKATQRVPTEFNRTLKPKIDKLNMLAIQMLNFQKKVSDNYDATMVEFNKLQTAIAH